MCQAAIQRGSRALQRTTVWQGTKAGRHMGLAIDQINHGFRNSNRSPPPERTEKFGRRAEFMAPL